MSKEYSKRSFLRTSQHFYRALAILEPQIYVVLEQFGVISLLSGRLVDTLKQNGCQKSQRVSILERQFCPPLTFSGTVDDNT